MSVNFVTISSWFFVPVPKTAVEVDGLSICELWTASIMVVVGSWLVCCWVGWTKAVAWLCCRLRIGCVVCMLGLVERTEPLVLPKTVTCSLDPLWTGELMEQTNNNLQRTNIDPIRCRNLNSTHTFLRFHLCCGHDCGCGRGRSHRSGCYHWADACPRGGLAPCDWWRLAGGSSNWCGLDVSGGRLRCTGAVNRWNIETIFNNARIKYAEVLHIHGK